MRGKSIGKNTLNNCKQIWMIFTKSFTYPSETLFPPVKKAGITRLVTTLDPLTRKEVKRPIYEVASSHMARRTFIGNIYKQVKDQHLVSSLTGHSDNSRACVRYRNIDIDMKQELVNILD